MPQMNKCMSCKWKFLILQFCMHILNAAIKVKILVSMCANYTTAGLQEQDYSRKQNYVHYFLYLPTVFNQKQLILGNWLELRLE